MENLIYKKVDVVNMGIVSEHQGWRTGKPVRHVVVPALVVSRLRRR